jgi:hypothetical protein
MQYLVLGVTTIGRIDDWRHACEGIAGSRGKRDALARAMLERDMMRR